MASSRPYYWAKYWVEAGHDVHILTTFKTPKDGILDYYPENLSDLKVRELSYWPYSSFLKNPTSSPVHANRNKDSNDGSFGPKFFKLLSPIRKSLLPLPLHKVWWIKPAVRYAMDLNKSWPYDVVISIFSPLATHIVASILKKSLDIFWVADYRDPLTGNHHKNVPPPFSLVTAIAEKYFLKRADLISTASQGYSDKISEFHQKHAITIENGFDPSEYKIDHDKYFPDNDNVRLIYTGTIYPGKQDPSPLFEAIKILKKEATPDLQKLEILFFCRSTEPNYLKNLVAKYDISHCIKLNGFVDRKSSLQIQREANAIIFLDWNDIQENGVLPGKLFEYMYSGTPILSIGGSEQSIANKLIKDSGTGTILTNSVHQIKKELQNVLRKQKMVHHPSFSFLAKYHKKALAQNFLNQISEKVSSQN